MAPNSLFPGFVDIFYTTNGHQHKQRIPVDPYVGVGGAWGLNTKVPGPGHFPWTAGIDAYMTVFRPLIHSSGNVNRAELWTMASPTADPIFQEAYEIGLAGTGAGATVPNAQAVWTFRTDAGGIVRVYVMESQFGANAETFPPTWGGSGQANLANFVIGNTSFFRGRDGSPPKAGIRWLTKTNDKLRKKYILDS